MYATANVKGRPALYSQRTLNVKEAYNGGTKVYETSRPFSSNAVVDSFNFDLPLIITKFLSLLLSLTEG